jgi:DNA-binding response OmpR family regulator
VCLYREAVPDTFANRRRGLGAQEQALLDVLIEARGRVVSRAELRRRAGLAAASDRRCDVVLVGLRRALGPGAVTNVRGRGWRVDPSILDNQVQ